jgi:secreted trypsin-like serine protease
VDLVVSTQEWNNTNMFLTELNNNSKGEYKDPCSGDSGGPLMYKEPSDGRWVIIGKSTNYISIVFTALKDRDTKTRRMQF